MKANEQLLDSGLDVEALVLAGFSSIIPDDCKARIDNGGTESKMQLLCR